MPTSLVSVILLFCLNIVCGIGYKLGWRRIAGVIISILLGMAL